MKTLVVLAALAAVALAAPAQPDRSYERFRQLHNKYLSSIKREKKSSQSLSEDAKASLDIIPELSVQTELDSVPAPSARTFKKPIIIKKKHGYHFYRDSEEERAQADPQESCTQELKFKVCNPELVAKSSDSDNLKSSTIEDANEHRSDSEIESTIQMAREAVDHLQKMPQLKKAGTDAEINEDIEVVRMALEHIQKNLGNLESMSLRAATLSEAETVEGSKMAKSEVEKMSQWKEAIENIQKNVEIARSIEDSFKSKSLETDPISKESKTIESSHRFAEEKTSGLESGKNSNTKAIEVKDDMTLSASEPKEAMIELHDIQEKSGLEAAHNVPNKATDMKNESEHIEKGKSSENVPDHDEVLTAEAAISDNMQMRSSWKGMEQKNTLAKSTEIVPEIDSLKTNSMHGKSAETLMQSKSEETLHKESIDSALHTGHGKVNLDKSMKSAESAAFTNELELNTNQDNMMMKSADQLTHQTQNVPSHLEHLQQQPNLKQKAAEHSQPQAIHSGLKTPMKAAEQIDDEFQQQVPLENFDLARHGIAEPLHHHHMPPAMHSGHYGHMSHGHEHMHHHHHQLQHYPMSHGHMTHHGKEADMDSTMDTTMQINMKDATGKSALEHNDMLQWKHEQDARGAYGGGYGAGAAAGGYGAGGAGGASGAGGAGSAGSAGQGAVGVFPHAHVGNCGIPLLLSCSPSVTSGSLAKSHSYGPAAPAYRAGEINTHNKRDTTKTNEITTTKVKRNPRKVAKKIPTYSLNKNL